jgi:hypothetical protein
MSTPEPNPRYADAAAVAGLAREVEGLRRGVEPLQGLSGQVEDLARVVTELAERVATSTRRARPGGAPSWLDLPADLDLAQSVLADLVEWLSDVYLRYADAARSFPDCWLWHPDVVEELLWLMAAWTAAYRAEAATVALAGDWHDRYRPGVVRRIKASAGTCSVENHLPRGDRPGGARPVVPIAEAMAPIAAWWAQHRPDTPPVPTGDQLATPTGRPARSRHR